MQLVVAQEACIPYRLEVVPGSFCLLIDKTGSKKGVAQKPPVALVVSCLVANTC